jgi:uncharacterized RmlC-like cupin family protein
MRYQSIQVVRPEQFDSATAQTPGSQRFAAIYPGASMASPMRGGLFSVEPGAHTGIHRHGEQPNWCAICVRAPTLHPALTKQFTTLLSSRL